MSAEYHQYRGRFWLFGIGMCSRGGLDDFKGSFSQLEDAEAYPVKFNDRLSDCDWVQILDVQTGELRRYELCDIDEDGTDRVHLKQQS